MAKFSGPQVIPGIKSAAVDDGAAHGVAQGQVNQVFCLWIFQSSAKPAALASFMKMQG